jgi:hypothetical protein
LYIPLFSAQIADDNASYKVNDWKAMMETTAIDMTKQTLSIVVC